MTALITGKVLLGRNDLPRLGINLSNSTLLRLEAKGRFPRRVRLGAHSVAWFAAEIRDYIVAIAAERESAR